MVLQYHAARCPAVLLWLLLQLCFKVLSLHRKKEQFNRLLFLDRSYDIILVVFGKLSLEYFVIFINNGHGYTSSTK